MATKAKTARAVDDVDGVDGMARHGASQYMEGRVDLADLDARAAVEQFEQQAWAMRPTEHLAVRAVLKLLWLVALEIRALRRGEA